MSLKHQFPKKIKVTQLVRFYSVKLHLCPMLLAPKPKSCTAQATPDNTSLPTLFCVFSQKYYSECV